MDEYTAVDAGRPSDDDVCVTFGKYNGTPVSKLPMGYIYWLLVDKATDSKYERGNYKWIKAENPLLFECIKRRMHSVIDNL